MKKTLLLMLCLGIGPPLLRAQLPSSPFSGTITASGCMTVPVGNKGTVTFQVTGGAWSGTIQPQGVIDGNAAFNIQVIPFQSTTAQNTVTANGVYTLSVAGLDSFKLCGNTVSGGTATVKGNAVQVISKNSPGGGGGGGAPTGAAGGSLAGTYPNPTIAAAAFNSPSGDIGSGTPVNGHFLALDATGGITAIADGVHSGIVALAGNTTVPVGFPLANSVSFLGPNSASFTAYGLQLPTTAPSGTQTLNCGTPSSSVSTCSWVTGSTTWDTIGNPAGSLNLSMGANTSTFNTTTANATFFNWKNTTAAIVGTSQGSPVLSLCGRAFHGSADVEDCLTLKELPGNGNDAAIVFTIGHTGTSTGAVTTVFPGPLTLPSGTAAAPSFSFSANPNIGIFNNAGSVGIAQGGFIQLNVSGNATTLSTNSILNWNIGGADVGISRGNTNVVAFGNGTAGSTTAELDAAGFQASGTKFTATGCSNGTTLGGATAGSFVSGTTGTCTVVITMGNALTGPNGVRCSADDLTTPANQINQTLPVASTQCTISGTTVTGDVIVFSAMLF